MVNTVQNAQKIRFTGKFENVGDFAIEGDHPDSDCVLANVEVESQRLQEASHNFEVLFAN